MVGRTRLIYSEVLGLATLYGIVVDDEMFDFIRAAESECLKYWSKMADTEKAARDKEKQERADRLAGKDIKFGIGSTRK